MHCSVLCAQHNKMECLSILSKILADCSMAGAASGPRMRQRQRAVPLPQHLPNQAGDGSAYSAFHLAILLHLPPLFVPSGYSEALLAGAIAESFLLPPAPAQAQTLRLSAGIQDVVLRPGAGVLRRAVAAPFAAGAFLAAAASAARRKFTGSVAAISRPPVQLWQRSRRRVLLPPPLPLPPPPLSAS